MAQTARRTTRTRPDDARAAAAGNEGEAPARRGPRIKVTTPVHQGGKKGGAKAEDADAAAAAAEVQGEPLDTPALPIPEQQQQQQQEHLPPPPPAAADPPPPPLPMAGSGGAKCDSNKKSARQAPAAAAAAHDEPEKEQSSKYVGVVRVTRKDYPRKDRAPPDDDANRKTRAQGRWLYRAQVRMGGRRLFLGHHATEDDAARVREEFIAWFGMHEGRQIKVGGVKGAPRTPTTTTRTVFSGVNFPDQLGESLHRAAEKWLRALNAEPPELPYSASAVQHAIELGLKPAVTTDEAKVALRGVRAVTIEEIKALQEKCAANAAQIAKEREEGVLRGRALSRTAEEGVLDNYKPKAKRKNDDDALPPPPESVSNAALAAAAADASGIRQQTHFNPQTAAAASAPSTQPFLTTPEPGATAGTRHTDNHPRAPGMLVGGDVVYPAWSGFQPTHQEIVLAHQQALAQQMAHNAITHAAAEFVQIAQQQQQKQQGEEESASKRLKAVLADVPSAQVVASPEPPPPAPAHFGSLSMELQAAQAAVQAANAHHSAVAALFSSPTPVSSVPGPAASLLASQQQQASKHSPLLEVPVAAVPMLQDNVTPLMELAAGGGVPDGGRGDGNEEAIREDCRRG